MLGDKKQQNDKLLIIKMRKLWLVSSNSKREKLMKNVLEEKIG